MRTRLSDRDRAILRRECASEIEALRPLTALPGWEATFEAEARRWRSVGNGRPETSEARSEAYRWAIAHTFLLDEVTGD